MTGTPRSDPGELTTAAGPHVLVDDVDQPVLTGDDRHHVERVLRARPGSPMTVGDGAGRWRHCVFGPEVEPVSEVRTVDRSSPLLTVGFALVKSGRPELIVQKLTELGIDRIVPFAADRSVVRWDDARAGRNHERLSRVVREAVMQCRRAWLPEVAEVTSFGGLVAGAERHGGVVRADLDGRPLTGRDHTVLVGPEGGWSHGEMELVPDRVVLGEHVLRTETAAIAAAVLMSAIRSRESPGPGM